MKWPHWYCRALSYNRKTSIHFLSWLTPPFYNFDISWRSLRASVTSFFWLPWQHSGCHGNRTSWQQSSSYPMPLLIKFHRLLGVLWALRGFLVAMATVVKVTKVCDVIFWLPWQHSGCHGNRASWQQSSSYSMPLLIKFHRLLGVLWALRGFLVAMATVVKVTKVWIFFSPFNPKAHLLTKFHENRAVNNCRRAWPSFALYYIKYMEFTDGRTDGLVGKIILYALADEAVYE